MLPPHFTEKLARLIGTATCPRIVTSAEATG